MYFRPQRGGLKESMAEKVILLSSKPALAKHLGVPVESVSIAGYGEFDERTGWSTWTILVDGQAVGFVNQDVRFN